MGPGDLDRPQTIVLGGPVTGFERCTAAVAYRRLAPELASSNLASLAWPHRPRFLRRCRRRPGFLRRCPGPPRLPHLGPPSRRAAGAGSGPGARPNPAAASRPVTLSAEEDLPRCAVAVHAALYDLEGWRFSPLVERRHPVAAFERFAALCARHRVRSICAPALTLLGPVTGRARGRPLWREYLARGWAEAIGVVADCYVIQAQRYQVAGGLDDYAGFVAAAATAARSAALSAGRRITVLAGLSTGPGGRTVGEADLRGAVGLTSGVVDGYWLNVPRRGPACPTCAPYPRPDLALALLRWAQRNGLLGGSPVL